MLPSITIAVPSVTTHVITDPFPPASGRSKSATTSSFNSNASLSAATFSSSVNTTPVETTVVVDPWAIWLTSLYEVIVPTTLITYPTSTCSVIL